MASIVLQIIRVFQNICLNFQKELNFSARKSSQSTLAMTTSCRVRYLSLLRIVTFLNKYIFCFVPDTAVLNFSATFVITWVE